MRRLRIDGVYDLRTLETLKEQEIKDFTFDFRPLSFNFLQQYKFMEFVESLSQTHSLSQSQLFCHFSNESKDVVEKIKNDYLEQYPRDNFQLEFSDIQDVEYYKSFETDFIWHYQNIANARDIVKISSLRGLVLDYQFLAELHEQNLLDAFYNNFYQLIRHKITTPGFKIILQADWDSDFFPSLFDFFDFHLLSLPINSKIEVCYRNVDLNKVGQNIHFYKQYQF